MAQDFNGLIFEKLLFPSSEEEEEEDGCIGKLINRKADLDANGVLGKTAVISAKEICVKTVVKKKEEEKKETEKKKEGEDKGEKEKEKKEGKEEKLEKSMHKSLKGRFTGVLASVRSSFNKKTCADHKPPFGHASIPANKSTGVLGKL